MPPAFFLTCLVSSLSFLRYSANTQLPEFRMLPYTTTQSIHHVVDVSLTPIVKAATQHFFFPELTSSIRSNFFFRNSSGATGSLLHSGTRIFCKKRPHSFWIKSGSLRVTSARLEDLREPPSDRTTRKRRPCNRRYYGIGVDTLFGKEVY